MHEDLKRILYLEDVEEIAEIGLMALEDMGAFLVKHCATGQEAIDAFTTFKPQLCLFDVMLPDISGLDVLKAIRAMPEGRNVPVVFMTAKAQSHEQELYRECGAIDVIVKPFNPLRLSDEVKALWAQHNESQNPTALSA
ncbi:DNA-binding response regulator MtrA [Methyloligella halotolerans]|uniref:DNA-binding response regulator MtrA n=1 Tax=Methyloligella halotolerans TaxID=1177755 RepID=A0A1E2S0J9_9HYPH|nr:response regulator [Methyloligella halotolerans]ODA67849.1 DNA-binding response regulator MtrA [Methyloligella halotolerans]